MEDEWNATSDVIGYGRLRRRDGLRRRARLASALLACIGLDPAQSPGAGYTSVLFS